MQPARRFQRFFALVDGQDEPVAGGWGPTRGLLGRQGTFAEYACVAEEWLCPPPAGVSDQETAAAALVGITAHIGLFDRCGLKPGETVFVNGGSGGVGSMVV